MKYYIILMNLIFLTTSSCQNSNDLHKDPGINETQKVKKKQCSIFLRKFQQKMIQQENDSALYYINKVIQCDSSNKNYVYQKVNFLKSINNFSQAIKEIELLNKSKNDIELNIEIAVLKLKLQDSSSEILLKKYYNELNKKQIHNSTEEIYLVALDNYVISKNKSFERIKFLKIKNKSDINKLRIIENIEESILKNKKEDVLFYLFNIEKNN